MHQILRSEVNPEMVIPPVSSVSGLEPLDIDTAPESYISTGDPSSQNTQRDVAHIRHSTNQTISSDRRRTSVTQSHSKQPSRPLDRPQQQYTNQQSTPKKQSPGFVRGFTGATTSNSIEYGAESLAKTQADQINELTNNLREKDDAIKAMVEKHTRDQQSQEQAFHDEWRSRKQVIEHEIQKIRAQDEDTIKSLQAEVQKVASHRNEIQEKYNTFLQRQQEESLKQMGTGHWLPKEESRVLADFERIRTQMRTWARSAAVRNIAAKQDVEEEQYASLMASLSLVAVVENDQLPNGLPTAKGPSLLLNALLAHNVYTSLFRSPFFFLDDILEDGLRSDGRNDLLKIYDFALASNVEDAHIWRSNTLRLLLPPPRAGNTDGEMGLHQLTKKMIAEVAEMHASRFAVSPAQYLIDPNTANMKKLISIYQEAASVSYMLWTRKTAMRLVTLSDMGSPTFDVDDSKLKPHTLVHPDDHDDKLKGRKIALLINPLLKVYGTDEGRDYDNARVWVPAEVWFDTR